MAAVAPGLVPTRGRRSRDYVVPAVLASIVAAAAALRFYGLAWGAPYAHFHIDEHFVFVGAYFLRDSMEAAASSTKFFMYGTLPMHMLNGVLWMYERLNGSLDLTALQDQVTYMVMGRAISATMGTATILVVYFIGKRVSNRTGGLLAAALLATTVMHISESHSFRVDLTMIFFLTLAWLFSFRIAEHGAWRDYVWAGVTVGAAIGAKYSAVFVLGVVALAHLLAPRRPDTWGDARGWTMWAVRGLSPLVLSLAMFAIVNPMAFIYRQKFWRDVHEQIIDPVVTGSVTPFYVAQFSDVSHPTLYWFTTNLWWSLGPALEVWGLLGIAFLLWQWRRPTLVAAAFPVCYFLIAGGTGAPMARYTLPLTPAFAVAAGALSASLLGRPAWRHWAIAITCLLVGTTSLYALAYMNIYRSPDARLEASAFLRQHVPQGARILVEPAHSTPPTGQYWEHPQFLNDYVLWNTQEQKDYYTLYSLDTYRFLYNDGPSPQLKHDYIHSRLDLVDYVLMDDFYVQMYEHLPNPQHAVVKYYYKQLFNGDLGFDLIKTFKAYPSLAGFTINDDGAELSSRMNDHPRIYIFKRREPHR